MHWAKGRVLVLQHVVHMFTTVLQRVGYKEVHSTKRKLKPARLLQILQLSWILIRANINDSWSQRPRGLRRRSVSTRSLRLWVWIPPGEWMLSIVRLVCCQVEVSATSWSLAQRSPTDCGASLNVIKKPREWGGPGPFGDVAPNKKIINNPGQGKRV